MNNVNIALAFDYLEDVNYALVQSKMNICNWCIIENNSDADMEIIQLENSGKDKTGNEYMRIEIGPEDYK